jgi:hypothetical protein
MEDDDRGVSPLNTSVYTPGPGKGTSVIRRRGINKVDALDPSDRKPGN